MKKLIGLALLLALATARLLGQINPNDPSLRLWLKADTLTGADVPVWRDSSSHGLVLAVPPLPSTPPYVDTQDDLPNHTPQLITVTNGTKVFKAVQFRQANDPINGVPHTADRLWQTNKLDASDPTYITPGEDLTLILVWRNLATAGWLGPNQCVVAKRGSGSSAYLLGYSGNALAPEFITYAGSTVYPSGLPPVKSPEWGIVIMNIQAGGTMQWRQYYGSQFGWSASSGPVARGAAVEGVPLTLGWHTDGPGGYYERSASSIAEVALFNRTLPEAELAAIQQQLLLNYFLEGGAATVDAPPANQTRNQFEPATFVVSPGGTPPFTYQWLKAGAPIAGATNQSFTLPSVGPGDQAFYSVAVSNRLGGTTSPAAFLTVVPDTTPPALASALLNVATNTQVVVTFTELVGIATAANPANYTLAGGSVGAAAAVPLAGNTAWPDHVLQVVLTTSPVTTDSTLTAAGVQDRAGLAAPASALVRVPVIAGAPPAANRLLWLAAGTNVLADEIGVYEWQDLSGAANTHHAVASLGSPQRALAAFPNGLHPVVSFDGTALLTLQNQADFNLQNFSVYLVGAVNTSNTARDWLGNWEGWVLGSADGDPTSIKWSHWQTPNVYRPLESGPVLQNMVPAYIVGTFSADTQTKTLLVNARLRGTQAGTGTIEYGTARGLALGSLFDDVVVQPLVGNLAEVLIYAGVSPAQDAAVQQYIGSKYFGPGGARPTVVSAANEAAGRVRVQFSDPLDAASAATAGNYTLNGGATVQSAALVNSTVVELGTSALAPNQSYTLSVSGVKNWAATPVAPNSQVQLVGLSIGPIPGDQLRLAGADGDRVLSIEAENFTANASPSAAGNSWVFATVPTFLGPADANPTRSGFGVMEAQPDNGVNTGAALTGPRLDYHAYFPAAGTYYSWVRGLANSTANDSLFIGLDGVASRGITGFPAGAGYTWGSTTASALTNHVVVTRPGFHVVNIWMREDGFAFDKLVLSTNPALDPTGLGPAESPLIGSPLEWRYNGDVLTLTWGGSAVLTASPNANGPFTDVPGATSPRSFVPSGAPQFFRLR